MDLLLPILVVDDDREIRELIGGFLAQHGYRVRTAADVAQMHEAIAIERPCLMILDVMMPGEDGLSAARKLANNAGPPVIMLSALDSDTDRIIGLEIGADDYLTKPCNPRELLARVRAVLRRQQRVNESGNYTVYRFADWQLDVLQRNLQAPDGSPVSLSDGEFSLLWAFVEHPQRILSRDKLLDCTSRNAEVYDRAIDSQISRLRRKINDWGNQQELIRTVRNQGYMLMPKVVRL